MSVGHFYTLCQKYRGRAVVLRTRDGRIHRGIIQHVDHRRVYIRPLGNPRNYGGFGLGYYRGYGFGGYGFFGGFGYGIALGALAGLALLPFFFW